MLNPLQIYCKICHIFGIRKPDSKPSSSRDKIHFHISGFRTPISKCTYSYISSTTYIIFIFEKNFFAKFLQRLSNFKSCFRGNPSIRRGQGSGLCSSRGDSISLCLQQNFDEILHSIEMNYLCLMKFAIHFGIRKPMMFFCSFFFQKTLNFIFPFASIATNQMTNAKKFVIYFFNV